MRSALSLALALALPTVTATGAPFPERDLVTFLSFSGILATLLLHGLSLPLLIRWFRTIEQAEEREEEREEVLARRMMVRATLNRLDELAAKSSMPQEIVQRLHSQFLHQLRHLTGKVDESHTAYEAALRQLQREMLTAERQQAIQLHDQGAISDEVLTQVERQLDLEELRLEMEEEVERT
jgi:NhaP-type Na+/H+ or K+/H+ antiporter